MTLWVRLLGATFEETTVECTPARARACVLRLCGVRVMWCECEGGVVCCEGGVRVV